MSVNVQQYVESQTIYSTWVCASNHRNDMFSAGCSQCEDTRPCSRCGSKPSRMYAAGVRCDACVAATEREWSTWEPPRPVAVVRERPTVLEPQRLAQRAEIPKLLKSVLVWCDAHGIVHRETYARTTEHESLLFVAELDCVPWKRRRVIVFYVDGSFAHGLISDRGAACLRDVRQALGQLVTKPAPRAKKVTA